MNPWFCQFPYIFSQISMAPIPYQHRLPEFSTLTCGRFDWLTNSSEEFTNIKSCAGWLVALLASNTDHCAVANNVCVFGKLHQAIVQRSRDIAWLGNCVLNFYVPSKLTCVAKLTLAQLTTELLNSSVCHQVAAQVCTSRETLATVTTLVAVATFMQVFVQTEPVQTDKALAALRAGVRAERLPAHCCSPLQQQAGTAFSGRQAEKTSDGHQDNSS